jgi:hypothetical protein
MSAREPVQICLWARSWWLVGNGPSYLLFRAEEGRVMHLTTGIPRKLRHALKGFSAIQDGKLDQLVKALILIDTTFLELLDFPEAMLPLIEELSTEEVNISRAAAFAVLREIEHLIQPLDQNNEKLFEGRLARFASRVRAARRFLAEHGREFPTRFGAEHGRMFPTSLDEERSIFWLSDWDGHELLISDYCDFPGPHRVFRCEPDSVFAQCAQELWHNEQQIWGNQRTVLYRVPTRKELREFLGSDEPTVTKLCRAEGLDWLPRASVTAACLQSSEKVIHKRRSGPNNVAMKICRPQSNAAAFSWLTQRFLV